MFINFQSNFESLYLSYNPLTSRSIDLIGKYSCYIQILHIAKYENHKIGTPLKQRVVIRSENFWKIYANYT